MEHDYIKSLREEASSLKECFNTQCFQVITIVSLFYVYLFRFMCVPTNGSDTLVVNYSIGIAAYISLILIVTVLNVGIYKFEGANRVIGYILHLEREEIVESDEAITEWESLIKAYRIFHPPIENAMYERWTQKDRREFNKACKEFNCLEILGFTFKRIKVLIFKGKLKKKYRIPDKYRWYLPGELVHSEGEYSPGNYLRRMMFMLSLLGVVALTLVTLATFLGKFDKGLHLFLKVIWGPSIFIAVIALWYRPLNLAIRIEQEMFSIHSNSIFWSVVSKAHKRTLTIIGSKKPLKHYSFILSCLALEYVHFGIHRAHEWCEDGRNQKISEFLNDKLSDYNSEITVQENLRERIQTFGKIS